MASLRAIRRKKCDRKRRHESKEAALTDIMSMRRHGVASETTTHKLEAVKK